MGDYYVNGDTVSHTRYLPQCTGPMYRRWYL